MSAAKRETSLLEGWGDEKPPTVSVAATTTPRSTALDLGISGVTDLELLSVSSVSSVYKAVQPGLQRTVAVKVLHDDPDSPAGLRFETERRVTGQLTGHAGIVPLLDAGTTGGGKPYLMTPYYRRGSLAQLLVAHGPLTWRETAFLVESVAVTMSEVHGRGLIHGNLVPSNILLTDFLLPRVGDFAASTAFTTTDGDNGGAVAVDVEALGTMLFTLLIGAPATRRPEEAPELLMEVSAPDAVLTLIDRTMGAEGRAPTSAAGFVTELRRAAQTGTDTGPVPTIGTDTGRKIGQPRPSTPTSTEATATEATASAAPASTANGSSPNGSAPTSPAQTGDLPMPRGAEGLAPSDEARYILALVACIAVAVLVMVLAAALAVS
ncbi:MAG: protein kinase [Actinomycetota bacterium]